MAFHQQFGVRSRTRTSNTSPGPSKAYKRSPNFASGSSYDETTPLTPSLEQKISRGHHTFPLRLRYPPVHGDFLRPVARHHLHASAPRAQSRHAPVTFTHAKSLDVDAAYSHPHPFHYTPSPEPRAVAYPPQSHPHLPAQPHQSDGGKMYPIPLYQYPSEVPHPLQWVGGSFSPYALRSGSQQTYHAQQIYQGESNGAITTANPYDPFTAAAPSLAAANHATHQSQVNPYTQDTNNMGGASYYQGQNNFAQPVRQGSTYCCESYVQLTVPSATISSVRSTRSTSGEFATLPKSGPRLLYF